MRFRWLLILGVVAAADSQSLADTESKPDPKQVEANIRADIARNPSDLDLRLRLARHYAHNDDPTQARRLALRILNVEANNWGAYLLVARIDAWSGKYKPAQARVDKVLKAQPAHKAALFLKSDIASWSGDLVNAEAALLALAKLGNTADISLRRARIAMRRSDPTSAQHHAAAAIALQNDLWPAYLLAADLDQKSGNFVRAYSRLQVLLDKQPQHRQGLQRFAAVARRLGKLDDAKRALDTLQSLKKTPEDELALAEVLAAQGKLGRARNRAYQVVVDNPEFWRAHIVVARLDAWLKKYDIALTRLERVLKAEPRNIEGLELRASIGAWSARKQLERSALSRLLAIDDTIAYRAKLAKLEWLTRRFDSAIPHAQAVITRAPKNWDAERIKNGRWDESAESHHDKRLWDHYRACRLIIAQIKAERNEVESALRDLDALRKDSPDYKAAHLVLAQLARKTKREARERDAHEALLKVDNTAYNRLQAARFYRRAGDIKRARKYAVIATELEHNNWPAQLFIARQDGWNGDHDRAIARLKKVIAKAPKNKKALFLLADIGIWAQRADVSYPPLETLEKLEPSADVYYRFAQTAKVEMRNHAAFRYAQKALRYDRSHAGAQRLVDDTKHITVDAASEFEHYPAETLAESLSLGTLLTVAVMPRARRSYTVLYQYTRRFATNNHLVSFRHDWRVSNKLTLNGSVRLGAAKVVPTFTAFAGGSYEFSKTYLAGLRYTYDRFTWPGRLHRLRVSGGIQTSKTTRFDANYTFGLLNQCGNTDPLQGIHLRGTWASNPWEVYLQYAFGMELERPPLPVYIRDLDNDGCPDRLGPDDSSADAITLIDTRAQEVGFQVIYRFSPKTLIRAGYGIQLRFNGGEVHLSHIGLRRSF